MPITLTDRISYIPASHGPLSADVFMFRGDTATWLFDVGLNDASFAFIEAMPGPKAAVLSHFHEDHTDNVKRLRLDALYGGKETVKHTGWGTVVDAPLTLEDGLTLTLFPLPSSHAKGALGLMTGDIAFLGDGTYCRVQFGRDMLQYNAQLLREELRVLESLPVRYFALSHEPQLLRTKEEVLRELRALYALRRSDSPYIEVPREKAPRTLSLTVTKENAGRRVRSLIKAGFALSEAMLGTLKTADGSVRRNGEACRLEEEAAEGDILSVTVEDLPEETGTAPASYPLPVAYEDEDILILEKPAGMAVHGEVPGEVNAAAVWAAMAGTDRPFHPVTRLDKGTSGLMVLAKSGYAHERLRSILHTEDFIREYLALAEGELPEAGIVNLPLGHEPGIPGKHRVDPEGKEAVTEYRRLAFDGRYSLVRLRLRTGRTHQIRVHLAALGHPLAGDSLYGGHTEDIGRPALHAASVFLRQPVSGACISLSAALPEDMRRLISPRAAAAAETAEGPAARR